MKNVVKSSQTPFWVFQYSRNSQCSGLVSSSLVKFCSSPVFASLCSNDSIIAVVFAVTVVENSSKYGGNCDGSAIVGVGGVKGYLFVVENSSNGGGDCDGSAIVGGGVKGEMVGGSAVLEGIYSGLHCFSPESTAQYFIHKRLRY